MDILAVWQNLFAFAQFFFKLMQINIGENRRKNSSLWRAVVRFMILPVFHVSGFEKFGDKPNKFSVFYFLRQKIEQNTVVNIIEKGFDVAFDKPFCSVEIFTHLLQCAVTTSFWSETVRKVNENRLVGIAS